MPFKPQQHDNGRAFGFVFCFAFGFAFGFAFDLAFGCAFGCSCAFCCAFGNFLNCSICAWDTCWAANTLSDDTASAATTIFWATFLNIGVKKVIFVLSEEKKVIQDHFVEFNKEKFSRYGKDQKEGLKNLYDKYTSCVFQSVIQENPLGLGNALLQAKDYVKEDSFIVALPDAIFSNQMSPLKTLLRCYNQRPGNYISLRKIVVLRIFCQEILGISSKESDTHIKNCFSSINNYLFYIY